MKYCYECGTKLYLKPVEGEGDIPYCPACGQHRFPIFNTAVSTEVLNPDRDKILLIQQYGHERNILVAGYVNRGESAEQALVREVKEELGLGVTEYHYVKSEFFPPSNTLMINYSCVVDSEDLDKIDRSEVDQAEWFTIEEAKHNILKESVAESFLLEYLRQRKLGIQ